MAAAIRQRRKSSPRRKQTAHNIHTNGNAPVAEIIGRGTHPMAQASIYRSRYSALPSLDATIPDYAFYDLLRRGKQPGYKLGALFAKRIEHIFSGWTLGRGVDITLTEAGDADNPDDPRNYTDGKLSDFLNANHSLFMTVEEDKIGLGDQYIVINADGTLSVPSPDTVEVVRDELDYRMVLAIRITTKLEKATIVDEYRADGRTVTIRTYVDGKPVDRVERYANLIGRIPVIHLTHGMSGNETNGHSIHEDLLKLYDQYDNVIHKQIDGAVLLGNPIPTVSGLEDLAAVIDANKPQTPADYVDQDGAIVTRPELNVDSRSFMLVGKGGKFEMVAPPVGFSADTQQTLKTLFLLLLDRTGIPEFIWGNEMSSARASSDTQMIQWAHDVEGLQKADERWLLEMCMIWLLTVALVDPQIVVDALEATWPPVLDENQELKLKAIEMANSHNLLTNKTTLELLQLVDDAEEEVAKAQVEAEARMAQEQARMEAQVAAQAKAAAVSKQTGGVGEMVNGNGYNELEAQAIVAGAIKHLAGG